MSAGFPVVWFDPQPPLCGICGEMTKYEDESYDCHLCLVTYDSHTMQASRIDPSAPVCGQACEGHRGYPHLTFTCHPCPLTAGHDGWCWNPCTFEGEAF